MYCNTAFGDYPAWLPDSTGDHLKGRFTGWMLLNYNKPVTVSSVLGGYLPNYAVDEDIRTYWSAQTGNENEWIQTDLGDLSDVYAIQINYADQDADREICHKRNQGIRSWQGREAICCQRVSGIAH